MKIINIIFRLFSIDRIIELFKTPLFCRHEMKFWDMKLIVEDESSHIYRKFNDAVFKDTFCQCVKCGVQKKRSMKVGDWGKWENTNFIPSNDDIILIKVSEI